MNLKLTSVTVVFDASRLSYGQSRDYHYLVPDGDEPRVGDIVITSISGGAADLNGYPVTVRAGRLTEVHAVASPKTTKFYIQLLSVEALAERRKSNRERAERVREQGRVRAQLELLLREQSDRERFAALAQTSPEAAALLRQLEEL